MTKQTKLELTQINARLARDNEALRAQVADLTLKLEMMHAEQAAHSTPTHRVQAHMPAWQAVRAQEMAAAKAIAMATGRVTKV